MGVHKKNTKDIYNNSVHRLYHYTDYAKPKNQLVYLIIIKNITRLSLTHTHIGTHIYFKSRYRVVSVHFGAKFGWVGPRQMLWWQGDHGGGDGGAGPCQMWRGPAVLA